MCTTVAILASRNVSDAPPKSYLRVVASLTETPQRLDEFADAIPPSEWRRRPKEGGFALVEHVLLLHSIDLEGYRARIERILTEFEPELPDIDGDRLAEQRRFLEQNARAGCVAFATVRRELVARLASLGPADRQKTGVLEGFGPLTVEELVSVMAAHDREHLQGLARLRAEICGA